MDALSFLLYLAEWGLVGLILYYVIEALPMPGWAKIAAQGCLIAIAILAIVMALVGQRPATAHAPSLLPGAGPGPASLIRP
jgi:hypothetical protein